MLSRLDKKIIALLVQDLPLAERPFQEIALRLGIKEKTLLFRLQAFRKSGLMRKFTSVINHRKIGYRYNAMVVWNIPDKYIHNAGKFMASYPQVSHCYQRKRAPGWDYSLYSMIHGRTRRECLDAVKDISRKVSCKGYRVLFSSKEYKKAAVDFS